MDPNEITPEEAGVDGTLSVLTEAIVRIQAKLRSQNIHQDSNKQGIKEREEAFQKIGNPQIFKPKSPIYREEVSYKEREYQVFSADNEDEKLSKRLLNDPQGELEAEEILDGAKNVWSGQMKDPFTGEVGQTFAVGEKPENVLAQVAKRIRVTLNNSTKDKSSKIIKFIKRVLERNEIKAAAWIFGVPLSLIAYHGIHGNTWLATSWAIGAVLFLVSSAFISLLILVIFGRRSEFIHLIIISRLPQALQRIWYRITIPVYPIEISGLRFVRLKVNQPKAKVLVIEPLSLEIISELNRRFGDMDIDLLDIRSELVKEGESWKPGIHGKLLELVKSQHYDYVVGYINENYDEDFFREAKLKGLILFSTAIHHIDLDAATKYGTVVTNAPGPTTIPVAEGLIAFFLDVIFSNKVQTKKSKGYTRLSELKSDPENSLVIAQALWYSLMRNVLKLEEMFKFGASDKYVRVGVGEEATVYHGKIGQSVYDESSPTIGIIGLDEVGLKLAEIAMAHEPAIIYVLQDELNGAKLLRLNSYKEILEQTSTTERLAIRIQPVSLSELLKHSSYVLRTPAGVQRMKGSRMKIASDANQIFIKDLDELIHLTSPITVGVLGLGRIGEASAQRFISLGANLLIQQRDPGRQEYIEKRERLAQLAEVVGGRLNRSIDVQYVDKEIFLRASNVISLSPPKKTNETVGWVNREGLEIFGELAQGSLRAIISITKDVVDETAMITYLNLHPEVEYRTDVASDEEKGGFFKRFIDPKGNRLKNAKVSGHTSAAHGGSKKAKQRIAFNNNLRQLMINKRPANQLNDMRLDSSGVTFLDQTSEAIAHAQGPASIAAAPPASQIQNSHAQAPLAQTQIPAPATQSPSPQITAPPIPAGTPTVVTSHGPMGQLAKTAAEMIEAAFITYYEKFFTITARAKRRFDQMDWENLLQDVEERLGLYNNTLNDLENSLRALLKNKLRDIPMWIEIQGLYSGNLIDNRILGANPYVIGMVFCNSIAKRIFGPEADVFEYTFEEDFENRTLETNESFLYSMYRNRLPMEYILTDILVKLEFSKPLRDIRKDIRRAVSNIDSELAKLGLTQDHINEIEVVKAPFFRNRDCYVIGRITTDTGFLPFALFLKNTKQGIVLSKVLLNADDIYRLFSSTRANFHVLFYYPLELVTFLITMIPRDPVSIYASLGFYEFAEQLLYKKTMNELAEGNKVFQIAEGLPGRAMVVITLPGFPYVLKIMKDVFEGGAALTRNEVVEKYREVSVDPMGRMLNTFTFDTRLPKRYFHPDLLALLKESAKESVRTEGDYLHIQHSFVQRKITPLNLFLDREGRSSLAQRVALDFGKTLEDILAEQGKFPKASLGDFGVTDDHRVLFYGFDKIVPLTSVTFDDLQNLLSLIPQQFHDPLRSRHPKLYDPDYFRELLEKASRPKKKRSGSGKIVTGIAVGLVSFGLLFSKDSVALTPGFIASLSLDTVIGLALLAALFLISTRPIRSYLEGKRIHIWLKFILSYSLLGFLAYLLYGSNLNFIQIPFFSLLANILLFGFFTTLSDLLGQWMSGRKINIKQTLHAFPAGLFMGAVTAVGFALLNNYFPKDSSLPYLLLAMIRVVGAMVVVRARTFIYARLVEKMSASQQSEKKWDLKEIIKAWFKSPSQDKQFESFWMTRIPSFIKNFIIQMFVPEGMSVAAEGVATQFFALFYSWSVNKDWYLDKSLRWQKWREEKPFIKNPALNVVFVRAYLIFYPVLYLIFMISSFAFKGFIQQRKRFNEGILAIEDLINRGEYNRATLIAQRLLIYPYSPKQSYLLSKIFAEIGLNESRKRVNSSFTFMQSLVLARQYLDKKYPKQHVSIFGQEEFEFLLRGMIQAGHNDVLFKILAEEEDRQKESDDPTRYEIYAQMAAEYYRMGGQQDKLDLSFSKAVRLANKTDLENSHQYIIEKLEEAGITADVFIYLFGFVPKEDGSRALTSVRFGEAYYKLASDQNSEEYFAKAEKMFELAEETADQIRDDDLRSKLYDLISAALLSIHSLEEAKETLFKARKQIAPSQSSTHSGRQKQETEFIANTREIMDETGFINKVRENVDETESFSLRMLNEARRVSLKRSKKYLDGFIKPAQPHYKQMLDSHERKLNSVQRMFANYRKAFLRGLTHSLKIPMFLSLGMAGGISGGGAGRDSELKNIKLPLWKKFVISYLILGFSIGLLYGSGLEKIKDPILSPILNIVLFALFTVLNDILAQWITGRKFQLKQTLSMIPIGILFGIYMFIGFWMINFFMSANAPYPYIVVAIVRILAHWGLGYGQVTIYAFFVGKSKSVSEGPLSRQKSDEAFLMARIPGFINIYIIQMLLPTNVSIAAEGITSQLFRLFYAWAANKDGFIIQSERWGKYRKNPLFLIFFPVIIFIFFPFDFIRSRIAYNHNRKGEKNKESSTKEVLEKILAVEKPKRHLTLEFYRYVMTLIRGSIAEDLREHIGKQAGERDQLHRFIREKNILKAFDDVVKEIKSEHREMRKRGFALIDSSDVPREDPRFVESVAQNIYNLDLAERIVCAFLLFRIMRFYFQIAYEDNDKDSPTFYSWLKQLRDEIEQKGMDSLIEYAQSQYSMSPEELSRLESAMKYRLDFYFQKIDGIYESYWRKSKSPAALTWDVADLIFNIQIKNILYLKQSKFFEPYYKSFGLVYADRTIAQFDQEKWKPTAARRKPTRSFLTVLLTAPLGILGGLGMAGGATVVPVIREEPHDLLMGSGGGVLKARRSLLSQWLKEKMRFTDEQIDWYETRIAHFEAWPQGILVSAIHGILILLIYSAFGVSIDHPSIVDLLSASAIHLILQSIFGGLLAEFLIKMHEKVGKNVGRGPPESHFMASSYSFVVYAIVLCFYFLTPYFPDSISIVILINFLSYTIADEIHHIFWNLYHPSGQRRSLIPLNPIESQRAILSLSRSFVTDVKAKLIAKGLDDLANEFQSLILELHPFIKVSAKHGRYRLVNEEKVERFLYITKQAGFNLDINGFIWAELLYHYFESYNLLSLGGGYTNIVFTTQYQVRDFFEKMSKEFGLELPTDYEDKRLVPLTMQLYVKFWLQRIVPGLDPKVFGFHIFEGFGEKIVRALDGTLLWQIEYFLSLLTPGERYATGYAHNLKEGKEKSVEEVRKMILNRLKIKDESPETEFERMKEAYAKYKKSSYGFPILVTLPKAGEEKVGIEPISHKKLNKMSQINGAVNIHDDFEISKDAIGPVEKFDEIREQIISKILSADRLGFKGIVFDKTWIQEMEIKVYQDIANIIIDVLREMASQKSLQSLEKVAIVLPEKVEDVVAHQNARDMPSTVSLFPEDLKNGDIVHIQSPFNYLERAVLFEEPALENGFTASLLPIHHWSDDLFGFLASKRYLDKRQVSSLVAYPVSSLVRYGLRIERETVQEDDYLIKVGQKFLVTHDDIPYSATVIGIMHRHFIFILNAPLNEKVENLGGYAMYMYIENAEELVKKGEWELIEEWSKEDVRGVGGIIPFVKDPIVGMLEKLFPKIAKERLEKIYNVGIAFIADNLFAFRVGGLIPLALALLMSGNLDFAFRVAYIFTWPALTLLHSSVLNLRLGSRAPPPENIWLAALISMINLSLLFFPLSTSDLIAFSFLSHFLVNLTASLLGEMKQMRGIVSAARQIFYGVLPILSKLKLLMQTLKLTIRLSYYFSPPDDGDIAIENTLNDSPKITTRNLVKTLLAVQNIFSSIILTITQHPNRVKVTLKRRNFLTILLTAPLGLMGGMGMAGGLGGLGGRNKKQKVVDQVKREIQKKDFEKAVRSAEKFDPQFILDPDFLFLVKAVIEAGMVETLYKVAGQDHSENQFKNYVAIGKELFERQKESNATLAFILAGKTAKKAEDFLFIVENLLEVERIQFAYSFAQKINFLSPLRNQAFVKIALAFRKKGEREKAKETVFKARAPKEIVAEDAKPILAASPKQESLTFQDYLNAILSITKDLRRKVIQISGLDIEKRKLALALLEEGAIVIVSDPDGKNIQLLYDGLDAEKRKEVDQRLFTFRGRGVYSFKDFPDTQGSLKRLMRPGLRTKLGIPGIDIFVTDKIDNNLILKLQKAKVEQLIVPLVLEDGSIKELKSYSVADLPVVANSQSASQTQAKAKATLSFITEISKQLAQIVKMTGVEVEKALWDLAHQIRTEDNTIALENHDLSPVLNAIYKGGIEDQLIPPIVVVNQQGEPIGTIKDGDRAIFINFRTDRAKPITYALTPAAGYEGLEGGLVSNFPKPKVHFVTMTNYDDAFVEHVQVAFEPAPFGKTYSEIIAAHGYKEVRFMESEKWRAGTWFLDGRRNIVDQLGIDVRVVPSPKKASYVEVPEMSAVALTDEVISVIENDPSVTDIFVNYANPDMVSHAFAQVNPKGDFDAVVKAIQVVDEQLGRLVEAALQKGWVIAITADHGNAEELYDKEGNPMPGHSTNKVPFILLSHNDWELRNIDFIEDGSLSNIAPTLLELRGIAAPKEMTSDSLIFSHVDSDPSRKIMRIVLDGWGLSKQKKGNAIARAGELTKLNMDHWLTSQTSGPGRWLDRYPHTALNASSVEAGYPMGVAGTTEFGHVNLDGGRHLQSDLTLINQALEDGSFAKNMALLNSMFEALQNETSLHLMGLVSHGSKGDIHASMEHLFMLLRMAKAVGLKKDQVKIHVFTDGRDSGPQSAVQFIKLLQIVLDDLDLGMIVDVMGRGWAMDRDNRWLRISSAYDAMVGGIGAIYVQESFTDPSITAPKKEKSANWIEKLGQFSKVILLAMVVQAASACFDSSVSKSQANPISRPGAIAAPQLTPKPQTPIATPSLPIGIDVLVSEAARAEARANIENGLKGTVTAEKRKVLEDLMQKIEARIAEFTNTKTGLPLDTTKKLDKTTTSNIGKFIELVSVAEKLERKIPFKDGLTHQDVVLLGLKSLESATDNCQCDGFTPTHLYHDNPSKLDPNSDISYLDQGNLIPGMESARMVFNGNAETARIASKILNGMNYKLLLRDDTTRWALKDYLLGGGAKFLGPGKVSYIRDWGLRGHTDNFWLFIGAVGTENEAHRILPQYLFAKDREGDETFELVPGFPVVAIPADVDDKRRKQNGFYHRNYDDGALFSRAMPTLDTVGSSYDALALSEFIAQIAFAYTRGYRWVGISAAADSSGVEYNGYGNTDLRESAPHSSAMLLGRNLKLDNLIIENLMRYPTFEGVPTDAVNNGTGEYARQQTLWDMMLLYLAVANYLYEDTPRNLIMQSPTIKNVQARAPEYFSASNPERLKELADKKVKDLLDFIERQKFSSLKSSAAPSFGVSTLLTRRSNSAKMRWGLTASLKTFLIFGFTGVLAFVSIVDKAMAETGKALDPQVVNNTAGYLSLNSILLPLAIIVLAGALVGFLIYLARRQKRSRSTSLLGFQGIKTFVRTSRYGLEGQTELSMEDQQLLKQGADQPDFDKNSPLDAFEKPADVTREDFSAAGSFLRVVQLFGRGHLKDRDPPAIWPTRPKDNFDSRAPPSDPTIVSDANALPESQQFVAQEAPASNSDFNLLSKGQEFSQTFSPNPVSPPKLNKDETRAIFRKIYIHLDGIGLASTIAEFHKNNIFKILSEKDGISMQEITDYLLKQGKVEKVNKGHMHAAMVLLEMQGWLKRKGKSASDSMQFYLTPQGKIALDRVEPYKEVTDFVPVLARMKEFLFDSKTPLIINQFSFQELVKKSQRQWDILQGKPDPQDKTDEVNLRIADHLRGFLIGPVMVALKDAKVFEKFHPLTHSLDLTKIGGNLFNLRSAFDLLEQEGWAVRNGNVVTLTRKGMFAAEKAWTYGVTVSYLPMFSRQGELFFGEHPEKVFERDANNIETHLNRPMNLSACTAIHDRYFKELTNNLKEIYDNSDFELQPSYIQDTGGGDGSLLLHMHEYILNNTERGRLMKQELAETGKIEKYKISLIDVDINPESLEIAHQVLNREGIPNLVFEGTVNDPRAIAQELVMRGIPLNKILHVHSFVDHNRDYQTPKEDWSLRITFADAAFVDKVTGRTISNEELQQNLVEHFRDWGVLINEFGLLMIESHVLPASYVAEHPGETLSIPFYATHAYSGQFTPELKISNEALLENGLILKKQSLFPSEGTPTISVSRIVSLKSSPLGTDESHSSLIENSDHVLTLDFSKDENIKAQAESYLMQIRSTRVPELLKTVLIFNVSFEKLDPELFKFEQELLSLVLENKITMEEFYAVRPNWIVTSREEMNGSGIILAESGKVATELFHTWVWAQAQNMGWQLSHNFALSIVTQDANLWQSTENRFIQIFQILTNGTILPMSPELEQEEREKSVSSISS
ncbi:MAG: bifunctional isocitrate dehydrogenase kinase/phosphatase [Elusimicrobia bacterium]|nr:bifunctional isocitrate dehydrogenase kinase/phosphatase [Elusimicrobiota bacterium]